MRMTFRHMEGVVSFSYNKGRPLFGMGHDGPLSVRHVME